MSSRVSLREGEQAPRSGMASALLGAGVGRAQGAVGGAQRVEEGAAGVPGVRVLPVERGEEVAGVAAHRLDGALDRLERGRDVDQRRRHAGVEHALGDEERERVRPRHGAIVGVGVLLDDLAADAPEQRRDRRRRRRVQRARADHGAQRALAAPEAHRAEERVGRDPRHLAPEARGQHRRGRDLDAPHVEDDLIRGEVRAQRGDHRVQPGHRHRQRHEGRPRGDLGQRRGPLRGRDDRVGIEGPDLLPRLAQQGAEGAPEPPVADDGDGAHTRRRIDRTARPGTRKSAGVC